MLSSLSPMLAISSLEIALIVALPLSIAIGTLIGIVVYKKLTEKRIGSSKTEASRILEDARLEAKTMRKEALLEAKEEQLRLRNEFEKESKQRRIELQKQEARLNQKEDSLDKKERIMDSKLELLEKTKLELEKKELELKEKQIELDHHSQRMLEELEKIAGLTSEEAKTILIDQMTEEAKKEASAIIREIENKAKEEGEKKAKNIISLAIQRCAVDHSADTTVSVVELPNEEMKGRIIGRVGRNIKALESVTGVDIIIDDTPDVVTLTGFDPVRREIARLTLQKLIADGRIHPQRIEEIAERVKRDINQQIKEMGDAAVFDTGLYGVHPELVKLLGRLKYRTSYGQNVLNHSMEVAYLAGLMAQELGADVKTAKRAGLLHDIGKAVDQEYEGTHIQIGVELARKYKENEKVIHAIAAHHGDIEANSVEAVLVQAADAISGSRPGARRESLENYVKRLEKLENLANSFAGVEQSYAIQAGREIRVIVQPDKVDDAQTLFLAKEIAKKLESELEYPGQIKVNVIRELRSVEYAK
ncbi:MAG: ribonuclease Y [Bacillota bacterium]|jgi:ribonuclease Y|nr:ribonuclease Y [Bacillota bacterium]